MLPYKQIMKPSYMLLSINYLSLAWNDSKEIIIRLRSSGGRLLKIAERISAHFLML